MENNQRSFVDTFAARTVVGYDKGQLLVYQIDGLQKSLRSKRVEKRY